MLQSWPISWIMMLLLCPSVLSARERKMRFVPFIIVALLTSAAIAQTVKDSDTHRSPMVWEPPEVLYPDSAKATVKKELLTSFRVRGYVIALDETAMKDVQGRLGGQIGSREDHRDALEWLCYHGADAGGRWVLWLENDEMNGSFVGSFQWAQLSKSDVLDPRCHLLDGSGQIKLPLSRLVLGTAQSEILESLGPPSVKNAERFVYLHRHAVTVKTGGREPFISSNMLIIFFSNGAVRAVQGARTMLD